jgi:hypothetical protein
MCRLHDHVHGLANMSARPARITVSIERLQGTPVARYSLTGPKPKPVRISVYGLKLTCAPVFATRSTSPAPGCVATNSPRAGNRGAGPAAAAAAVRLAANPRPAATPLSRSRRVGIVRSGLRARLSSIHASRRLLERAGRRRGPRDRLPDRHRAGSHPLRRRRRLRARAAASR